MKKILYISFIFIGILLMNSCSKEEISICNDMDPFAIENGSDDTQTRGQVDGSGNGGIIDPDKGDEDLDEDDDQIVDPDEDDDDMDEDDDEAIDGTLGGNGGEGV